MRLACASRQADGAAYVLWHAARKDGFGLLALTREHHGMRTCLAAAQLAPAYPVARRVNW
ncbi:MAG: hypothetical protein KAY10_07155 [Rhodoferax sp.]|nr:hypothetical protein [Rhodoferax sp.]